MGRAAAAPELPGNGTRAAQRSAARRPLAERLAQAATRFAGSTSASLLAVAVVLAWLLSGPLFDWSSTWQLVINTGTTIVTFLMVFLIQRSQNKEALALQLKLNEIVSAMQGASNRLVNVEDLGEDELNTLHRYYRELAEMAKGERDIKVSHSVEEAGARHRAKLRSRPARPSR